MNNMFSFESVSKMAGYDGNIQADMVQKYYESGKPMQERYICSACGSVVLSSQWSEKYQACQDCTNDYLEGLTNKHKENQNGSQS